MLALHPNTFGILLNIKHVARLQFLEEEEEPYLLHMNVYDALLSFVPM